MGKDICKKTYVGAIKDLVLKKPSASSAGTDKGFSRLLGELKLHRCSVKSYITARATDTEDDKYKLVVEATGDHHLSIIAELWRLAKTSKFTKSHLVEKRDMLYTEKKGKCKGKYKGKHADQQESDDLEQIDEHDDLYVSGYMSDPDEVGGFYASIFD